MDFFTPKSLSKKKLMGNHICHYKIKRNEAESMDFERIDIFMSFLSKYGSLARQKVLFSFDGYDFDKRELIDIPEPIQYTRELINKQHPYFWYYAIPHNSEFFYLALLMKENNRTVISLDAERKFFLRTNNEQVINFIKVMAINLNIYGEEIKDIDGAANCLKLWSEKIIGKKI